MMLIDMRCRLHLVHEHKEVKNIIEDVVLGVSRKVNPYATRNTFCSAERGFLPHCSCVYCGELVIDLAKISLGLRSIEHL